MAKKDKKIIKELFEVDPYQGACAALIGIKKEGYRVKEITRKGAKAEIVFERI